MKKINRLLSMSLIIMLLSTTLIGCSPKNITDLYYTSGTRDEFINATKSLSGISDEIPKYYQDNYSVDLEIISITECKQSNTLSEFLIKIKFTTEDNKIGYAYDDWLIDNDKIVSYNSIWVDNPVDT